MGRGRSPGVPRKGDRRQGERNIEAKKKALAAAHAAYGKKGQNLTIIDIGDESSYADYLVIVSAYSDRQTSAIADAVVEELKQEHGLRPMVREGQGSWVLIDYGDVVIHVFHEDARAFYDLERLWSKAPRVPVPVFEMVSAPAMTH